MQYKVSFESGDNGTDSNLDFPILVGDIGGTNSRFGLVRDIHSELELFEPVKTDDFPDLQTAIQNSVLSKTSVIPNSIVIGLAGPILGDQYHLTNAAMKIVPAKIIEDLGLKSAEFMNDFPAQALGVLTIDHGEMEKIGGGAAVERGTRIVLGPGTSFGIATIVQAGARSIILPAEGACAEMGLGTGKNAERELKIQKYLTKKHDRQTIEILISGPGLENLYQAIWHANVEEKSGADAAQNASFQQCSAAQISAAAQARENPEAVEAVELFSRLLGRLAGNIALTVMATGGVFISGGMAHKMLTQIENSGFREEFENKAPQQKLVQLMPTYFVNRELAALEGLANYIRMPDQYDLSHANARFQQK